MKQRSARDTCMPLADVFMLAFDLIVIWGFRRLACERTKVLFDSLNIYERHN